MSKFGRGLAKEHFCEIISKSVHWFSSRSCLKFFLFIAVVAILFNRAKRFEQFWWTPTEHSCIIISKLMHWLRSRSRLKVFLFFSSGGHLVQRSGTVRAILVDSHIRNIPVKLFQNLSTDSAEEVVKTFLFIALVAILSNVAEWLEQFW